MRLLSRGSEGDAVRDIQTRLGTLGYRIDAGEHGWFGPATEAAVRAFQQHRQLLVDGIVGEDTWEELVEAGYALGDRIVYFRNPNFRGDDVRALQARLNLIGFDAGREDGIFGPRTDRALRDFQRNVGLPVDGILGATTLEALKRLRPVGQGPGRASVREGEALRRLMPGLGGVIVAIDAAHGNKDPGAAGPSGLREDEAAYRLALAVQEHLTTKGASPLLLRTEDSDPPVADRARRANDGGAEVLVSIHLNAHDDPSAEGASTYYFGRGEWISRGGQRLAELIQDELTGRLHLKDGRTHAKALPLLRETRMPAVQVEPCFITNPREEALLKDHSFRTEIGSAIARAVERFLGGAEGSGSVWSGGAAGGAPHEQPKESA